MKKIVAFLLLVTVMAVSLVGCNSTPKGFSGEWKFSSITKVELTPDLEQSVIDILKIDYNAEDQAGIEANALDRFADLGIFAPCYVKFSGNTVYTYDPVMEREATWSFYKLTDNTGFLSFYTELDASAGNPDPVLYPDLAYNAEADTMTISMNYVTFMVTVELAR